MATAAAPEFPSLFSLLPDPEPTTPVPGPVLVTSSESKQKPAKAPRQPRKKANKPAEASQATAAAPVSAPTVVPQTMATKEEKSIAETHSIFEIDAELDALFDEMQDELNDAGEISQESQNRFLELVEANGEKVDRIGRFLRIQENVAEFSKKESERLSARAKNASGKVSQTKSMVLFFMRSRNLKKLEGRTFTFRAQKNGQDSVKVTNEAEIPMQYKRIEASIDGALWDSIVKLVPPEQRLLLVNSIKGSSPINEAIKDAHSRNEVVPGVEVYRGSHLRIA